jgi:hypothetical protein
VKVENLVSYASNLGGTEPVYALVLLLEGAVVCGELGRDDHLVATAAVGHPLADPFLRLVVLVAVGGVHEVAALGALVVEDREGGFFVDATEGLGPEDGAQVVLWLGWVGLARHTNWYQSSCHLEQEG